MTQQYELQVFEEGELVDTEYVYAGDLKSMVKYYENQGKIVVAEEVKEESG
jgi:hypothetical protein